MFDDFQLPKIDLQITDWLTERVISLPIHTELDSTQLSYITENILDYLNK